MRITLYVKSDGENWVRAAIRHSPHVMSGKLDDLMLINGWIRWSKVREKFNELKKKVAKANPTKFPNWKEVEIPMRMAKIDELPDRIHKTVTLLDANGQPITAGSDTHGFDASKSAAANSITDGLPDFK